MKRLWLDLGDLGVFVRPAGAHDRWQDHGLGLLRTMLRDNNIENDLFSTRMISTWDELTPKVAGYDVLAMNVRSYTYPFAYQAAKIFKKVNPNGIVLVGGMHATVAPDEMETVAEFDHIVQGPGENIIVDLMRDPKLFPRMVQGIGAKSMADWPLMDRTLWPNPHLADFPWPLEPECGWGPGPVVTILTSRVCPWQCAFCNESSYIQNMGRKSVDQVIDELNFLDDKFGPIGSFVIHDSMFFQHPSWLKEWIEKYPRKAHKRWPYWAAGRTDTVRQWPDLFEAVVRETNWSTISLGFESGSDRVLKILNKECTAEDNFFAIDLLNKIGDDIAARGYIPPKFWANIMLGIPGETHEDAFDTIRMLKRMKRVLPSISYYAPYPGSALGYQLIAEGKSRMSKENYHRYPDDEKVLGIDYKFYKQLLKGKFERQVNDGLPQFMREKSGVYEGALIKA